MTATGYHYSSIYVHLLHVTLYSGYVWAGQDAYGIKLGLEAYETAQYNLKHRQTMFHVITMQIYTVS